MMNNSESKNSNNRNNLEVGDITELVAKIRERLAQNIAKFENELKLNKEELNSFNEFWMSYEKKEFARLLGLYEGKQKILNRVFEFDDKFREKCNKILEQARNECARIAAEYPALILEASQKAGVQIDETSMHPKYTFYDAFIILNVDDRNFKVKVYTREGTLFVGPFDITVVIALIKQESKRLFARKFDAEKFGKNVCSAYAAFIRKEKKQMGDLIPVKEIFIALKKKQKSLRIDEFIVDFSKFNEAGMPLISGYKIELKQTKDDRMGILLHRYESNGYIGFISINKEG
jgi:hypothetical protein